MFGLSTLDPFQPLATFGFYPTVMWTIHNLIASLSGWLQLITLCTDDLLKFKIRDSGVWQVVILYRQVLKIISPQ